MKFLSKILGYLLLIGGSIGIGICGLLLFTDVTWAQTKIVLQDKLPTIAGIGITVFLSIQLSFILQAILHEAGHLVCGLATGYRFVSFRVLNLTLIREAGQLRIKRFSVAGTGGQCLLTPPDRPLTAIPTFWYNMGGILANLLSTGLALTLLLLLPDLPRMAAIPLWAFAGTGALLILVNGIPMKTNGITNDGANALLLRNNPAGKAALLQQLRINARIQQGERPSELPKEWFTSTDNINFKDAMLATQALLHASYLIDQEAWEEAYEKLEQFYDHRKEVLPILAIEATCELIFTALVTGRIQRAETLYSPKVQNYVRQYQNVMSAKLRLRFAIAYYMESDPKKALAIYQTLVHRQDRFLMRGEVKSDLYLMERIREKENF